MCLVFTKYFLLKKKMSNQMIIIFINYYIFLIIHVFQHIYFYELFFHIYQSKLVSFFLKHSYTTITLVELMSHFNKMASKPHASGLLNFRSIPELFQHARTASKTPEDYYHISAPYQGYDALSFNPNNLQKIEIDKNTGLLMFHEKKMLKSPQTGKIPKFVKKYSVPKIDGESNRGARPEPVDQLEVGFFSREDYNNFVKKGDLPIYKKPSIILEDYSNIYTEVVFNHTNGGLRDGTIISDSGFEELKWFYNFLEKNEEMRSYMNNLLGENPYFPLEYM